MPLDRELLEARQDACRRHLPLWRDQHHLVADVSAECVRKLGAEDDAKRAGFEAVEAARLHMLADVRHLILEARQHTADDRTLDAALGREHALPEHVRRGSDHAGIACRLVRHLLPARETVVRARDLDVRRHAEDSGAQLLLESVHHRKHDDQRRHAEGDAEHRSERDEGDELVATFGPRVAQADVELVRLQAGKPRRKRAQCATGPECQPAALPG